MNKSIIILLISCVILGAAIGIMLMAKQMQQVEFRGFMGSANTFSAPQSATTSHGTVWTSTTAYAIGKNADRQYLFIAPHPYSTSTVWLWMNTSTDRVATGKGIPLSSLGTSTIPYFEIDSDNLYIGEVQLISEVDTEVNWFEK